MTSTIRTVAIALLSGLLLAGSLLAGAAGGLSETAAVAAPPQPSATYVSELGPASVQPPRRAPALPASGSGVDLAGLPWPKVAGLGLAICGALMIHAALAMRPRDVAHS